MYDELKERCRACSQGCIYPSECSYFDKPPLRCMRQLLSEAADAIEELSAIREEQKAQIIAMAAEDKPRWIPVPSHGELIDRAELWVEINKICDRRDAGIITDLTCIQQILSALRHAPTIVPAQSITAEEKKNDK